MTGGEVTVRFCAPWELKRLRPRRLDQRFAEGELEGNPITVRKPPTGHCGVPVVVTCSDGQCWNCDVGSDEIGLVLVAHRNASCGLRCGVAAGRGVSCCNVSCQPGTSGGRHVRVAARVCEGSSRHPSGPEAVRTAVHGALREIEGLRGRDRLPAREASRFELVEFGGVVLGLDKQRHVQRRP